MYVIVKARFTTDDDKEFGLRIWKDELTDSYLIDYYEDDCSNPEKPIFKETIAKKRKTKEVRQWLEEKLRNNKFKKGHLGGVYAKAVFSSSQDWLNSVLRTVSILNVKQKKSGGRK